MVFKEGHRKCTARKGLHLLGLVWTKSRLRCDLRTHQEGQFKLWLFTWKPSRQIQHEAKPEKAAKGEDHR